MKANRFTPNLGLALHRASSRKSKETESAHADGEGDRENQRCVAESVSGSVFIVGWNRSADRRGARSENRSAHFRQLLHDPRSSVLVARERTGTQNTGCRPGCGHYKGTRSLACQVHWRPQEWLLVLHGERQTATATQYSSRQPAPYFSQAQTTENGIPLFQALPRIRAAEVGSSRSPRGLLDGP